MPLGEVVPHTAIWPSWQLLSRWQPRALHSGMQLSSPSRSDGRENTHCWLCLGHTAWASRRQWHSQGQPGRLTQAGKWLSPRGDHSRADLMTCTVVLDGSRIARFVITLSCLWDVGEGIYSPWVSELSIKWETGGNLHGSKFYDCRHQQWNLWIWDLSLIKKQSSQGGSGGNNHSYLLD